MPTTPTFHRDRVFRDPVHGLIPISGGDEFLTDLINTPEFQRLHRIRQLGVASLTFPGADHSRFCHSLGVMHIASRILEVLAKRYRGSPPANMVSDHRRTILAAALLHDIGHGPFSHLMERAFKSSKDHELRTKNMITEERGGIWHVLKRRHGIDPEKVEEIIDHKFPFLFLQDIVSSQLDADRMDYLIRDSHFAGVDYGVFDLEWILNCLCIGSYSNDLNDPERWRLCLDSKRGLQAAEQLILARQHMSLQVYFHKSTRRWEAVFLCLIREAAALADKDSLPEGTPALVAKYLRQRGANISHLEFLRLDEPLMMSAFAAWMDSPNNDHQWLAKLAKGFLLREKVLEMVALPENVTADQEVLLRNRLEKEFGGDSSRWELDKGEFNAYKGEDPETRISDREGYENSVLATSIMLSDGETRQKAVPVAEVSEIFQTLIYQKFRLRRLFCDPNLKHAIDKMVRETITSDQLELFPENPALTPTS